VSVWNVQQASLFVPVYNKAQGCSSSRLVITPGSFISSSLHSSLIPFTQAHPHLHLDLSQHPQERPSFTPLKVQQRLWLIVLLLVVQNEGAQKKSASTTSNQTLTSQSLKPITSFVPHATSGSVLGLIPPTPAYHGMLIVDVPMRSFQGGIHYPPPPPIVMTSMTYSLSFRLLPLPL
jgi:hypothetical protein